MEMCKNASLWLTMSLEKKSLLLQLLDIKIYTFTYGKH